MERLQSKITALLLLVAILCLPKEGYSQYSETSDAGTVGAFILKQLQYSRVYDAAIHTETTLKNQFEKQGINYPPKYIYWRAFKLEKELELWAKNNLEETYTKIKTYPIYTLSGDLGPKRREGDYQIPEGCYKIIHFNPNSSYWLSFKLNYPNTSDSILGYKKKLGGEIFVHGDTLTIGCLPLTDSLIKEVYWISALNYNMLDSGSIIPFHIFPLKLTDQNWQILQQEYWGDQEKIKFWNSLQGIFSYFEDSFTLPVIKIDDKGYYKVDYKSTKEQRSQTNTNYGLPDSRTRQPGN